MRYADPLAQARIDELEAEVDRLRAKLVQAWDEGYDAGYDDGDLNELEAASGVNPYRALPRTPNDATGGAR